MNGSYTSSLPTSCMACSGAALSIYDCLFTKLGHRARHSIFTLVDVTACNVTKETAALTERTNIVCFKQCHVPSTNTTSVSTSPFWVPNVQVNTPASYSGGHVFETCPEAGNPDRFFVVSPSVLPGKCRDIATTASFHILSIHRSHITLSFNAVQGDSKFCYTYKGGGCGDN
jgi:hypothetical protein